MLSTAHTHTHTHTKLGLKRELSKNKLADVQKQRKEKIAK